jgi:PIN domain nuclease of toxin-antitoxin system
VSGLLLDTHTVIWWSAKSTSLSANAASAISARTSPVWVSAASIYEADYKSRIGRTPLLPLPLSDVIRVEGFACLVIDDLDAARAASLTEGHPDPFDRLIAAQAIGRSMTVVTRDAAIATLGAKTLW